MSSAIRHLSVASDHGMFAAAEFKNRVHLYRVGHAKPEKVIYTNLDFGGHRLQIVPSKEIVIAGAYHVHGIEGFCLKSGRRSWQRKDLKNVQTIRRNPHGDAISCFFEKRAGVVLDAATGEVRSTYRGVGDVYFSPDGEAVLEEMRSNYRLVQSGCSTIKIKTESFAILSAAFSKNFIAISEVASSVRIFSRKSGDLVGTYKPKAGFHVLAMHSDSQTENFIGILWGYESAGGYFLIQLSRSAEELSKVEIQDAYLSAFFVDRRSLLLGSGQEISWDTGQELFLYEFPQRTDETP